MVRMGFLLVVGMLAVLVGSAYGGWVLEDSNGETMMISGGKMRNISDEGGVIFDGGSGKMTFIDDRSRMFAQGTVGEFCSAVSSVYDAMMAGMPPEQRAMMEQMMAKDMGRTSTPKVAVKRVGSGGAVAGLETDRYEIAVDGEPYEEVWLATDKDLRNEMKSLIPLIMEFSECQGKGGMNMANEPERSPVYRDLMTKGWELKSVSHKNAMPETVTNIVRAERRDIPVSDFTPPTGYRQASFGEMMGTQMRMEQ